MKKLEYTDIARIYSNSIINIELKDGTVLKAFEFMFYNDIDNPDMDIDNPDMEVESIPEFRIEMFEDEEQDND